MDWTLFAGLLTLVVGAVICFGGYRFFRFLMVLVGFGTGFVLGALGVSLFTKTPFLTGIWAWVAAIVAGLVLGVLAWPFYAAGIAILGAAVGYLIGTGVMTYLQFGTALIQGAGVGAALVLVILLFVLRVHRAIVMIYTALAGGAIILAGALFLAGQLPLDTKSAYDPTAVLRAYPLWLLLWGGAALVGLGAQWASRPRFAKATPPAQPAPASATPPTAPLEPAPTTQPPGQAAESTAPAPTPPGVAGPTAGQGAPPPPPGEVPPSPSGPPAR